MMDALVKTLLCINFLCIIWYFLRYTVKENAKKYEFKHHFGSDRNFWALIPNVNLNFNQGFTFEIEFLCFQYYFDVTKKKDFSDLYQKIFDSIFSSVKVPEHLKLKPDFGGIPVDDFIDNCKKFSRMDIRDSKNDGWCKFHIDEIGVGNWIKIVPLADPRNSIKQDAFIFHNGENISFGFDHSGNWTDSYQMTGITINRVSPASTILVRSYLKSEAFKRGFTQGAYFRSLYSLNIIKYIGLKFDHCDRMITNQSVGVIYDKGKWAEIVKKNEGKTD